MMFGFLAFLISSTGFYSCKKNHPEPPIIISENNGLSKITTSVGVNLISQIGDDDIYLINSKLKEINNVSLDLNNGKFIIKKIGDNFNIELITKNNGRYSYVLENKSKSIIRLNNKKNSPDIAENKNESTFLVISMIIFNDIMNKKENIPLVNKPEKNNISLQNPNPQILFGNNLKSFVDEGGSGGGCERTIISLRTTETRAISHVNSATDEFLKEHKDCKRIYGIDSGCIWGGYGCIATQSITCTGGGCNVSYGQLD